MRTTTAIGILTLAAQTAAGATLYESTFSPLGPNSGFVPPNNLGFGAGTIFVDDAVIEPTENPNFYTQFEITRVTIGFIRSGFAPATSIELWSAQINENPDVSLFGFDNLASTSLPASTSPTDTKQQIVFGDGVSVLATIAGDTTWHFNGDVGAFFGISISDTTGTQGWAAATTNNPTVGANDAAYVAAFNPNTNVQSPLGFPPGIPAAMELIVEGRPVPAPSSLPLIGLASLAALRRRR